MEVVKYFPIWVFKFRLRLKKFLCNSRCFFNSSQRNQNPKWFWNKEIIKNWSWKTECYQDKQSISPVWCIIRAVIALNKMVDFQIDASSLHFEWQKPVASSAITSVSIRSRCQLEAKFLKAIAIYPIDDGIPQIMQATIGL